jgi:hypothetical protein
LLDSERSGFQVRGIPRQATNLARPESSVNGNGEQYAQPPPSLVSRKLVQLCQDGFDFCLGRNLYRLLMTALVADGSRGCNLAATSPRDSASDRMPLNDASTFFAIALDSLVDAFGNLGADLVAECDRFFFGWRRS